MSVTRLTLVSATAVVFLVLSADARAGIWGIRSTATSSPPAYSGPPVELFSINEDGSGYVDHGDIFNNSAGVNFNTNFDGLAESPHYGLMAFEVFGSGTTSRLATINPAGDGTHAVTGTKVNLELAGREIRGAAFDLKDRLWALDTINHQLLQVDPVTGGEKAGSAIGLTLGGSPYAFAGNTVDLAVRSDGSFFITAVEASPNRTRVYALDENTGALTLVNNIDAWYGEVGATFSMAAATNDMFAVDVSGAEDFVRYDLTGPVTRTNLFTLPNTMNSGRGDLASAMLAEPLFEHRGDANPYLDENWSQRLVGSGITVGPNASENSWMVSDQNSAGSNGYAYLLELTPEERAEALSEGWALRMELRVEGANDAIGGAVGAQVALPGPTDRIFSLGFGTDASGNPIAGIYNGSSFVQSAPIPGSGYHRYAMLFDPETQTVDVFADGIEILSDQFGYTHTGGINRVLFGANASADTGTGYYRFVEFQHRLEFIPEPSTFVLLGFGALGLLFARRRPKRR